MRPQKFFAPLIETAEDNKKRARRQARPFFIWNYSASAGFCSACRVRPLMSTVYTIASSPSSYTTRNLNTLSLTVLVEFAANEKSRYPSAAPSLARAVVPSPTFASFQKDCYLNQSVFNHLLITTSRVFLYLFLPSYFCYNFITFWKFLYEQIRRRNVFFP